MSFFDILPLFAGIGMFLYGMDMLAKAIERLAGARMEHILESLTSNRWKGLLLGTAVTAVIQSSAATTVTVIGFVNAGMMRLMQALPVVFGANIGSTVTGQILRLGDVDGSSFILTMLKPSSFAPILILIGAAINLMAKKRRTKNISMLITGFGILFFGMTTMEDTLAPLKDSAHFQQMFTSFENPFLGILAGFLLCALIQSSSASVGILQSLTVTGSVTFATTFPLLMGINIGKCIAVILASFGTNKNSRRVVLCHLLFNIFGAILFTSVFYSLNAVIHFPFLHSVLDRGNVADLHSLFNVGTALVLMPFVGSLAKLSRKIIPDDADYRENQALDLLDDRLLKNPRVAMEQCRKVLIAMGESIEENLHIAAGLITHYDDHRMRRLQENEHFLDKCEAAVGEYLVRTTHHTMTEEESHLATEILQTVSDYERIGDYCVNISETAQFMAENKIEFSEAGRREMQLLFTAVFRVVDLTVTAFRTEDEDRIYAIEPLEETIDTLVEKMRNNHVQRLQDDACAVESGISFIELLNSLERISDHCSNIAIYIIQKQKVFENFDRHSYLDELHKGRQDRYQELMDEYRVEFLDALNSEDSAPAADGADTLASREDYTAEETLVPGK